VSGYIDHRMNIWCRPKLEKAELPEQHPIFELDHEDETGSSRRSD